MRSSLLTAVLVLGFFTSVAMADSCREGVLTNSSDYSVFLNWMGETDPPVTGSPFEYFVQVRNAPSGTLVTPQSVQVQVERRSCLWGMQCSVKSQVAEVATVMVRGGPVVGLPIQVVAEAESPHFHFETKWTALLGCDGTLMDAKQVYGGHLR